MTRWLILAVCLLTRSAAAANDDEAWAAYRFAPNALTEIDLSSDTARTLCLDGGPARPIRVTAGGWNSDFQPAPIASDAVKDHAVCERKIDIPAAALGLVDSVELMGRFHCYSPVVVSASGLVPAGRPAASNAARSYRSTSPMPSTVMSADGYVAGAWGSWA